MLNSYSITPVLNIVQTFLNEDKLYNAIVDLPQTANFLGSITAVATHAKFKVLEGNDEFLLLSSNICRLYKLVYAFVVIDLADIVLVIIFFCRKCGTSNVNVLIEWVTDWR